MGGLPSPLVKTNHKNHLECFGIIWIYTANMILMLGIFLSSASALILINTVILFVYYLLSALVEEKAILKKFPKYRKYKSDTGMFLPNIIKN